MPPSDATRAKYGFPFKRHQTWGTNSRSPYKSLGEKAGGPSPRWDSNAYLSQLENGKISKPSPNVLHTLASVYGVSYGKLMERAGYVSPVADSDEEVRHGQVATYAVENLTREEEKALLEYLAFYRSRRDKR